MKILDNIIALRILYLLVSPFEKQEAFKTGAIDKNGDATMPIAQMNDAQKSSYTMLQRLCFRLKKVLGKLPFGKTTLASMAAAYVLVRECMEAEDERDTLEEDFEARLSKLVITEQASIEEEKIIQLLSLFEELTSSILTLSEEGVPATTTANIQTDKIVISPDRFKKLKKEKFSARKIWVKENLGDHYKTIICDETGDYVTLEESENV